MLYVIWCLLTSVYTHHSATKGGHDDYYYYYYYLFGHQQTTITVIHVLGKQLSNSNLEVKRQNKTKPKMGGGRARGRGIPPVVWKGRKWIVGRIYRRQSI